MRNLPGILILVVGASMPLVADTHTITGIVSDTTCGANHRTADAPACTRDCVKKGADYALVVNGEVYTVKADKNQKEKLAGLVGKVAVVRGDFEGMTITASKVSKQKKIKKH